MASGHVSRTRRPNRWLRRPALRRTQSLDSPEPSTDGPEQTRLSGHGCRTASRSAADPEQTSRLWAVMSASDPTRTSRWSDRPVGDLREAAEADLGLDLTACFLTSGPVFRSPRSGHFEGLCLARHLIEVEAIFCACDNTVQPRRTLHLSSSPRQHKFGHATARFAPPTIVRCATMETRGNPDS